MDIEDIPEGNWILFDIHTNTVLFHSNKFEDVMKESEKYGVNNVSIQIKISNTYFNESKWT